VKPGIGVVAINLSGSFSWAFTASTHKANNTKAFSDCRKTIPPKKFDHSLHCSFCRTWFTFLVWRLYGQVVKSLHDLYRLDGSDRLTFSLLVRSSFGENHIRRPALTKQGLPGSNSSASSTNSGATVRKASVSWSAVRSPRPYEEGPPQARGTESNNKGVIERRGAPLGEFARSRLLSLYARDVDVPHKDLPLGRNCTKQDCSCTPITTRARVAWK
jgi:hypothetical protein